MSKQKLVFPKGVLIHVTTRSSERSASFMVIEILTNKILVKKYCDKNYSNRMMLGLLAIYEYVAFCLKNTAEIQKIYCSDYKLVDAIKMGLELKKPLVKHKSFDGLFLGLVIFHYAADKINYWQKNWVPWNPWHLKTYLRLEKGAVIDDEVLFDDSPF